MWSYIELFLNNQSSNHNDEIFESSNMERREMRIPAKFCSEISKERD
jgi:hypothetical protein